MSKPIRVASAAFTWAALALVGAAPAQAADAGISIQISPPGVFGRIDISGLPQPRIVLPRPVVVAGPLPVPPPPPGVRVDVPRPAPVVTAPPPPVYMWVPPGHRRDWKKHCHRYQACGVPVYFVHDDWYHQHVHPRRDDDHGRGHGHGKDGKGKEGKGKEGKGRDRD